MKKGKEQKQYGHWIALGIVGLILVILVGIVINIASYTVHFYNGATINKANVETQWHNVNTEEQRRADLIVNMASVVSGYGKHEHDTLVDTIKARSAQLSSSAVGDTSKMDSLGEVIAKLMVLFEQYPDIKAMPMYQDLNNELKNTENRIQRNNKPKK